MSKSEVAQSSCRICGKIFCCQNCREQHEKNFHDVNTECDICIYGRVIIKDPSESLLEHIKDAHWPLHCVCCERVFLSMDDIFLHSKCPKGRSKNETPPVLHTIASQETEATNTQITTSTPLIPREEEDIYLQKMTEVITPVDAVDKNKDVKQNLYKSALTPSNHNRKNEDCSKRRVTFRQDIPEITEEEHPPPQNTNSDIQTPNSKHTTYSTAQSKNELFCNIDEITQNDINETVENDTTWESAINDLGEGSSTSMVEVVTAEETKEGNSRTEQSSEWFVVSDENSGGIWTSMTNIFKNMMQGLSSSEEAANRSLKRPCSSPEHLDCRSPVLKRMKLTDIKCRRPIRYMKPALYVRYGKKRATYAHKLTQTE